MMSPKTRASSEGCLRGGGCGDMWRGSVAVLWPGTKSDLRLRVRKRRVEQNDAWKM